MHQKQLILRRTCFNEKIKLQVVKNTLLAKAMDNSNHDFGELIDTFLRVIHP